MTKLTDGKRTVGITLREWRDEQWTPDWSGDFFQAGGLKIADGTDDVYVVEDVDYCIDQACDWKNSRGDYYDEQFDDPNFDADNRDVDVTEI